MHYQMHIPNQFNIRKLIMNNFWQFSWRDIALTKSNKHLRKSLRGTYYEKPCMHKS